VGGDFQVVRLKRFEWDSDPKTDQSETEESSEVEADRQSRPTLDPWT